MHSHPSNFRRALRGSGTAYREFCAIRCLSALTHSVYDVIPRV